MKSSTVLFTVTSLWILTACATVEERWLDAKRCGSEKCLAAYLSKYPNAAYAQQAKVLLLAAENSREREEELAYIWSFAQESVKWSDFIEEKSWTEEPCRVCQSVQQDALITAKTAKPTIPLIGIRIREYLSGKSVPPRNIKIATDRESETILRLRVFNLKSEVLPRSDYWEYLYLDISLSKASIADKYEFSLSMSGKFRAGGLPATIAGYDDMITKGYSDDLNNYARALVSAIKKSLENDVTRSSGPDW